ncbi:MAG TPA: hypothetical protein PL193_14780 [Xanthobacteraceae bacterium]|nr:hypothetical protein [Xanthobacteraceae bacterium]
MARLLITNGDHAATALAAHFPDAEILIWRDVLVEGPVPGGIDGEALADIRARHIEQSFGMHNVRDNFTRRNEAFARISDHDNVELWLETDLHDQLQLIELLARFAKEKPAVSPRFVFSPPPISSHIDRIAESLQPVQHSHIETAIRMWTAFREPSPEALHALATGGGALPEARAAFLRLLEEYPSPHDGLGRIERHALLAIRDSAITPGLAFRHYQQTEELPFLGDLGFFHRMECLAAGAVPLLQGLPAEGIAQTARSNRTVEYTETLLELTDAGNAVLEGKADHVMLNGIDRWIGGVHLTSDNVWRYDPENAALSRG